MVRARKDSIPVRGISDEMKEHARRWQQIRASWPDGAANLEEFGIWYRRNSFKLGLVESVSVDKWK